MKLKYRSARDFSLLVGLDCLGLIAAHYLTLGAQALAVYTGIIEARQFTLSFNLIQLLPVFLFFFGLNRLYTRQRPFWDEARELTRGISVSVTVILLLLYFTRAAWYFSLARALTFWFIAIITLPTFRWWGKIILYHIGIWRNKVLILGAGQSGQAVAAALIDDPYLGCHIVGFLDDNPDLSGQHLSINGVSLKVFGKVRHFRKFVNKLRLDTVIIAMPSLSTVASARITNSVQKYCRNILLVPDLKGIALLNTELQHLFDQQLFLLHINNNLLSQFNRLLKRCFDLAIAIALLPLLLPAIAIIAVLIRLETGHSAFFIQQRLGRNRSLFRCIKFQTMFPNADAMLDDYFKQHPDRLEEWQQFKKIRGHDPRVTRIGDLLRQTSLDELPQIFNVLSGDMSLVGPRPYLPREEEDMKDYIDTILLTTPGITGLWQVRGRNQLDFTTRMQLDNWYVLNWSMWSDIEILFKTIRVVLFREGAF